MVMREGGRKAGEGSPFSGRYSPQLESFCFLKRGLLIQSPSTAPTKEAWLLRPNATASRDLVMQTVENPPRALRKARRLARVRRAAQQMQGQPSEPTEPTRRQMASEHTARQAGDWPPN